MKIKTVKVSEKGQIAIPKDIRITIGIDKGEELVVIQSGNKIMISKASDVVREIADDFSDMLIHSEENLKDLWDNNEDEIWNNL